MGCVLVLVWWVVFLGLLLIVVLVGFCFVGWLVGCWLFGWCGVWGFFVFLFGGCVVLVGFLVGCF
ncbi:hypothetical protein ACTHTR_10880, partial [Neisseria sp. P0018.S004]